MLERPGSTPRPRPSRSSGWISSSRSFTDVVEIDRRQPHDRVEVGVALADLRFEIAAPRSHAGGRQRLPQPLLALLQPHVRPLELCGALGDAPLEIRRQLLELPVLPVQLGEDAHLGAQDLRDHRHRHVVDGARLVAADAIEVGHLDGGDEDDRRLLVARMPADHLRQLEAVEIGHADVDEHDGDVGLQQRAQRLAGRVRLDQILAELAEDHLVAQQLRRLIVDEQDVDWFVARS